MRKLKHPLSMNVYEWAEDGPGPVKVTSPDGIEGRFDRDGVWLAGELRQAEPTMCRWIVSGGPDRPPRDGSDRRA